jgi:hypothetical protein
MEIKVKELTGVSYSKPIEKKQAVGAKGKIMR